MSTAKKIVVGGDIQYPFFDAKVFGAFVKFIKNVKPDMVVLNGDAVDFYDLSSYDKNPDRLGHLEDERNGFHRDVLRPVAEAAPKAARYVTEGNHEKRLQKYIWHHAPALSTIRDFHNAGEFLKVKDAGYTWVPDSASVQAGHVNILHGSIVRQESGATAKAHFQKYGVSMVLNHCHRLGSFYKRDLNGMHGAWEAGCLCDMKPEYDPHPNWQQGWAYVTVYPSGMFNVQLIPVIDGKHYVFGDECFTL